MEQLHERTFNPLLQFATLLQFESQEYFTTLCVQLNTFCFEFATTTTLAGLVLLRLSPAGTHSSDSRKFTCLAQRAAELLRLETKYKPPDQNIVLWV